MITIRSVTKRFGRIAAVDGVSLEIQSGQSVALWGSNGAGKTTLIRCVLGLLRFEGTIQVGGQDTRRHGKTARRLIGYVPQELGFYDDLGVAQAIRFFARLKNVPVDSVDDVLASVGLCGHGGKRIRELSGGMKQRLALAIALLGDPPVLILDEVTASLDACGRHEFVAMLARLSDGGRTMLFASHRVEEVGALAHRVVQLERGRITREHTAADFVLQAEGTPLLHLHLAEASRPFAMTLLREHNYAPRLNGVGLIVPVAADQKAAPFRVLAERGVRVDDFDFIPPGSDGHHTEGSR